MAHYRNIQRLLVVLCLLTLVLVGLGSYVRATGAGLSCPDWPLCFGKVVPDFAIAGVPQEVIHRYLATGVGLLTILLVVLVAPLRTQEPRLFRFSLWLLFLVIVQGVFGGLTVTMRLHPPIVATHLTLGTLFLQLVGIALVQTTKKIRGSLRLEISPYRFLVLLVLLLTFMQVIWGGYVAASGASLACLDFPLCNGAWIPENAVSAHYVQIFHRALGLLLVVLFGVLLFHARRGAPGLARRKYHIAGIFGVLLLQIVIGVGNVYMRVPPWMSVAHLVVAELVLFGLVSLYSNLSRAVQLYPQHVLEVK